MKQLAIIFFVLVAWVSFGHPEGHAAPSSDVAVSGTPTAAPIAAPAAADTGEVVQSYLSLGVAHILGGFDHLLFVLSLVVVARRMRTLVALASSFTLAHSITLSLAALGVVGLSPAVVEPAIALTLLAVAVHNLATRGERPHRALLVFLFGLLHGFGFAGALSESGLPHEHAHCALGAFNVGVELGQLAVIAVAWPLLRVLAARRVDWYRVLVPTASAGVVVISIIWFVQRVALTA